MKIALVPPFIILLTILPKCSIKIVQEHLLYSLPLVSLKQRETLTFLKLSNISLIQNPDPLDKDKDR